MKPVLYLLGVIAVGIPSVHGGGDCWLDYCWNYGHGNAGRPCTCDYDWENGLDGTCTSDGNQSGVHVLSSHARVTSLTRA